MSTIRFAPAIHTPKPRVQVSQVIYGLASSLDLNAEPGTYAVTGTDATLARGLFINAEPGSYAITGTDATLDHTLAAPTAVVVSAVKAHNPKVRQQVSQAISGLAPTVGVYEISADPGVYAVTGSDATLARGLFINAEPGSYAVTGSDATLARGLFVNAEPGTFSIAGSDATLARGLFVNAEVGTYAITGVDATLEFTGAPAAPRNTALIVKAHTPKQRQQVSQAISGLAPSLTNNYEINAEPGTYSLTGFEADLFYSNDPTRVWDRIVTPNYAHQTQQLVYGTRQFYGVEEAATAYELDAQPGTYAVTGSSATLARGLFINADDGAFTVTGTDATLARGLFLNAETGVYTITGFAADLPYGQPGVYALQADPGTYVLTGVDATLAAARAFTADPGSFSVTGIAAGLALERTVLADPGAYTITGTANAMLLTRVLDANTGSYAITGAEAQLGDVVVLGFFDQPTPSTDGFAPGPSAGVFDSPSPGVVRT